MDLKRERLLAVLSGERTSEPVRGITFVAPELLSDAPADPALALVRACADLRLDFAFVPLLASWADRAGCALEDVGAAALPVVDGISWPAMERLGVEAALRASEREPQIVRLALDHALEESLAAADRALAPGVSCLVVADDLAGASGPLLSPRFIETEVLPRLATVAARAAEAGALSILHCDGDVRLLLPSIRAAGFAAVHGDLGGPERFTDALAIARSVGIVLAGGIPTVALSDIEAGLRAGLAAAGEARAGGLIVCDDGGIQTREEASALLAALGAASSA